MKNYVKWAFFSGSLAFGQLANYFCTETALWQKFAITGASLCASGVILLMAEGP